MRLKTLAQKQLKFVFFFPVHVHLFLLSVACVGGEKQSNTFFFHYCHWGTYNVHLHTIYITGCQDMEGYLLSSALGFIC